MKYEWTNGVYSHRHNDSNVQIGFDDKFNARTFILTNNRFSVFRKRTRLGSFELSIEKKT